MKKTGTVLLLLLLFISCSSVRWVSIDSRMFNAKLGMTKAEIIKVVGNDCKIASSSIDENGNAIEVLSYTNRWSEEYLLKLFNDKLIEWHKEHIHQYKIESPLVQPTLPAAK